MNRQQAEKLHAIASKRFDLVEYMGIMGHEKKYCISVNGVGIFYSLDEFYERFPDLYAGPYRVKKTDEQWKIVYIESETNGMHRDIDGGIRYDHRQAAYRRCKQLNDAWHETEKALHDLESE